MDIRYIKVSVLQAERDLKTDEKHLLVLIKSNIGNIQVTLEKSDGEPPWIVKKAFITMTTGMTRIG